MNDADAEQWFDISCESAVRLSRRARQAEGNGALDCMLTIAGISLQRQLARPQNVKDTVSLARESRLNRAAATAPTTRPSTGQQPSTSTRPSTN